MLYGWQVAYFEIPGSTVLSAPLPSPNQYFGRNPALTVIGNPGVYSSIIPSFKYQNTNPTLRVCFRVSHPRPPLLVPYSTVGC